MSPFFYSSPAPLDQAHGLRQMFAAARQRFVPLVHNPHVAYGGVAMERLCAGFAAEGLTTLVVDAADTAGAPHEVASVDLSACIERLAPHTCFLAARGLPMRWLDARGGTAAFLRALAVAAPQADVVLVHAGAADLARLFGGHTPRPLLLASDQRESLTHAFASMKLLSQRLGLMAFDLLLADRGELPRLTHLANHLGDCADRFLAAALCHWAAIDPRLDERAPPAGPLQRLVAAQLASTGQAAEPQARHKPLAERLALRPAPALPWERDAGGAALPSARAPHPVLAAYSN